jgi:NAD+ synthase
MAYSNQFNELLLSTGNKSEYACGYATIYGDMCGGFAPLKDVYKTMVYKLANWRNENIPLNSLLKKLNIIPSRVINRAPSAELKPNQTDQDTLPSYDKLDKMLYHLIELNQTVEELIKTGWDEQEVLKLAKMLKNAEFKRRQSAPGIKISAKDFAKGRRYPITTGF